MDATGQAFVLDTPESMTRPLTHSHHDQGGDPELHRVGCTGLFAFPALVRSSSHREPELAGRADQTVRSPCSSPPLRDS